MVGSKRFGVALSGGGYRAAAFHIGTLKKLNDLNLLDKVDVLSTISGGSITGAAYCLHKGSFSDFEIGLRYKLSEHSVIGFVLRSWRFWRVVGPLVSLLIATIILPFTQLGNYSIIPLLIFVFVIVRFQFKLLPISKIIEQAYDRFFFNGAVLPELCKTPEIAIGATNLQTLRHFTFSARKMEDSAYAYYNPPVLFDNKCFPVSRAVIASSCVPFAFSPVSIDKAFFKSPELYDTVDPKLVDGGIYDNQGIHKLTQNNSSYACSIVLVSDAGTILPFKSSYNNTFTLLLRTVETFMGRIKNFQMMQNIYRPGTGRSIAYQSLGWDIENCVFGFYENLLSGNISEETLSAHLIPQVWLESPQRFRDNIIAHITERCYISKIMDSSISVPKLRQIRSIGTNLTRLKGSLVDDLITHAENLTEVQLRLYSPMLFNNRAES